MHHFATEKYAQAIIGQRRRYGQSEWLACTLKAALAAIAEAEGLALDNRGVVPPKLVAQLRLRRK